MPWTKLKNIILLILVMTNLFLLVFVLGQAWQNDRAREQTWENALLFLRERGVQVEEALLPRTSDLLPQVARRDLEGERAAAEALLQGTCEMESRGGEVYRYFNGNGSIQFHSDGTFSAQLDPAAFPLGEDRAGGCLALLEQIGFQGELLEERGDALTFGQTWDGRRLFNLQVTVTAESGGASGMTAGRRLVGEPEEDSARQAIDPASALVELFNGISALGDVCNQISALEQGYISGASLSGPMTLTPVWQVATDTGFYQLDLVTGGVSRLS